MSEPSGIAVRAPFAGVVVAIPRSGKERVGAGATLVVLEAMKMEHEVVAGVAGVVGELAVAIGDAVEQDQLLLTLAPGDGGATESVQADEPHVDREREDLRSVRERHEIGLDAARGEAVAKRHDAG